MVTSPPELLQFWGLCGRSYVAAPCPSHRCARQNRRQLEVLVALLSRLAPEKTQARWRVLLEKPFVFCFRSVGQDVPTVNKSLPGPFHGTWPWRWSALHVGCLALESTLKATLRPWGGRRMEAQLLCPLLTPRRLFCQGLFAKILGSCTELASGALRKTFSVSARPIIPRFQACGQRRFQKSTGRKKITCQRAAVLTARERFPCISAGSRVHSLATFRFCGKT